MTTIEAQAIIEKWNELRHKVEALLLLKDRDGATALFAEAAELPLNEARDIAYDSDLVGPGLPDHLLHLASQGEVAQPTYGSRVKRKPNLSDYEGGS